MNFKTNHEAVVPVLRDLNEIEGINETFITAEATDKVAKLLKLDDCRTWDELRAIRNSVVMIYGAFKTAFYSPKGFNMQAFDECQNRMSAITMVIDGYLWRAGCEV